jgi:hypothetical protein
MKLVAVTHVTILSLLLFIFSCLQQFAFAIECDQFTQNQCTLITEDPSLGCSCPSPWNCQMNGITGVRTCHLRCNAYYFNLDKNLLCGPSYPDCTCPGGFRCASNRFENNAPRRLCQSLLLRRRRRG